MWAAIKAKALVIKAAVVVFVVGYIKYLRAKNAKLNHEKKVKEKIAENREKQTTDRQQALEDEKQTIEKRVEESSGSRRDRFSKL